MNLYKEEDINEIIARNLRSLRVRYNLNQSEIGKVLGISFQQIQRYENAHNRISAENIYKLSKFFGVEIGKFFKPYITENGEIFNAEELEIIKAFKEIGDLERRKEAIKLIKSMSINNA